MPLVLQLLQHLLPRPLVVEPLLLWGNCAACLPPAADTAAHKLQVAGCWGTYQAAAVLMLVALAVPCATKARFCRF